MSNQREPRQQQNQELSNQANEDRNYVGSVDSGKTQGEDILKRRKKEEDNSVISENSTSTSSKKKSETKKAAAESNSNRLTSSLLMPKTNNDDLVSQRKNSVNGTGILKTSGFDKKQAGSQKKSQGKGVNAKQKIVFRQELQDVKIVENWKAYNSDNYQQTSCHCNTF